MANSEKKSGNLVFLVIALGVIFFVIKTFYSTPSTSNVIPQPDNSTPEINNPIVANLPVTPADCAICFVYDTSGSMNDKVVGKNGGKELKYVIANRALDKVIDRLQIYANGSNKGVNRSVYVRNL